MPLLCYISCRTGHGGQNKVVWHSSWGARYQRSPFLAFALCHILHLPSPCLTLFTGLRLILVALPKWLISPTFNSLLHPPAPALLPSHLYPLVFSFHLDFVPVSFTTGLSDYPYSENQFLPSFWNFSLFPLSSKDRCCLSRLWNWGSPPDIQLNVGGWEEDLKSVWEIQNWDTLGRSSIQKILERHVWFELGDFRERHK